MKNRIVAALLALFLGFIGIHKFYLGRNFAGLLYFFFSWTTIPGFIAFFEFFGLVFMSDQAFNAKYNGVLQPGMNTGIMTESSRDKMQNLREFKKLYDEGLITAEEYEDKRRKILDSI